MSRVIFLMTRGFFFFLVRHFVQALINLLSVSIPKMQLKLFEHLITVYGFLFVDHRSLKLFYIFRQRFKSTISKLLDFLL